MVEQTTQAIEADSAVRRPLLATLVQECPPQGRYPAAFREALSEESALNPGGVCGEQRDARPQGHNAQRASGSLKQPPGGDLGSAPHCPDKGRAARQQNVAAVLGTARAQSREEEMPRRDLAPQAGHTPGLPRPVDSLRGGGEGAQTPGNSECRDARWRVSRRRLALPRMRLRGGQYVGDQDSATCGMEGDSDAASCAGDGR